MTFALNNHDEADRATGRLDRRDLLRVGGLSLITLSAAGCSALSTKPSTSQPGPSTGSAHRGVTGSQMKNSQAPSLAAQEKAGKLPALKDRMPPKPLVVQTVDGIGTYGGMWRTALSEANETYIGLFFAGYEPLVRWSTGWPAKPKTVEPNVAESFESNDSATEYTFHLREGIKWSDGQPLSADDLVFAFNDVMLNTDLSPVPSSLIVDPKGKTGKIDKIDDLTVKVTFENPYGFFLDQVATATGGVLLGYPMHYCKKFHKKYTPDVVTTAKKNGFQDWIEQFQSVANFDAGTPDLPVLWAWRVTVPVGKGTTAMMERNPYYWKTDPNGNQLPYLDAVSLEIIEDLNTMLLKAESGDLNLELGPDSRFTTSQNKPVLASNRQRGGYQFLPAIPTRMNAMVIMLNLAHKDPVKRMIFNNKDFRIGLSYAINRPEVINATLQRQATPYQVAPAPLSPLYDKEFALQYSDFNVTMANQHLDAAGYTKKNGSGIRLGPDGKPIMFTLEYVPDFYAAWTDMLNLIKGYWQKVGVDVVLKTEDQTLWSTRTAANQHDASIWQGDGGLDETLLPRFYLPWDGTSLFGTPWATWYESGGTSGEVPPAAPKQQIELYNQVRATKDPTQQMTLMKQVLDIAKEQFYCIGVARENQKYFTESVKFRNIPNPIIMSPGTYPTPGVTHPEQYYLVS